MGAVVLRLLGELGDDDGGRGHRDGAADRHRGSRRDTEQPDDRRDDRCGREDLSAAYAEHLAAHREQARQREFQAEREHQEHHAKIGEQTRRFVVDDEPERVRAEQHADREVA